MFSDLGTDHADELLVRVPPLLVHIVDGPWDLLEIAGGGVEEAGQSCIFQNLSCLLLQEPHLEQGSENTCRMLDNLASSKSFHA